MIVSAIKPTLKNNERVTASNKINISFLGLSLFICGFPSMYTINLMGELYATEILLPVLTLMFLLSNKEKPVFQEKIFWSFILSTTVMIIGYIISDLSAGTSQFNYLRAWGRNAILFSDIVCLSIIATTDKRYLWWYIFGVSLGSIIYLQSTGVSFTHANWKLAYSQPLLLLTFVAGYFLSNFLLIGLIISVGIFSFFMDSRSFSSMCILLAGILWIRRGNPDTLNISTKTFIKITVICTLAVTIILSVLSLTSDDFSKRRDISSIGRLAALRIALIAIGDSPILGYGSWGEGTKKFASMLYKETQNEIHQLGQNNYQQEKTFLAHSQILQSWMEGGVFAAQLFIFYGYQVLSCLKKVILRRRFDYMTSFYCFFLISAFWSLLMSPYSGSHRLNIAVSIGIICAICIDISTKKSKSSSATDTY